MQKRQIGNSGIFVSTMGIGTTKFGRNEQVKYPKKFDLPSEQEITTLLKICNEYGVNLIDTAPSYGTSEQRLGKLLQKTRQNWVICTKVGERFFNGQSFYDFSKIAIQKSLENSLRLLKTDYLDIVLLHSDSDDEKILPSLEVLDKAKQKGLIRLFGISSKTKQGGITALKTCDLAMVHYNLEYKKMQAVLDFAKTTKKGILIKKALQSGHLVSNANKVEIFEKNIHFILKQPAISSIIIGTINHKHLQENLALFAN